MAVSGSYNGFKRVLDSDYSKLGIYSEGLTRLQFGSVGSSTYSTEGGKTSAILFGLGNTSARVTNSTANKHFMSFYLANAATSGYAHGLYIGFRNKSTATEGQAARFYTVNEGTVTSGSIHGMWASVEEATGGTNSGLSAAGRFTQTCAASVSLTGTRTCLQLDATYPSTATLAGNESFIRLENVGAGAKKIPYFAQIIAPDTTNMFVAATNTVIDHALKISVDGVPYWIGLYDATA